MTPKELLYVEDALAHEKQMQSICSNFASQIHDTDLRTFISTIASKQQNCYGKFYSLLNK